MFFLGFAIALEPVDSRSLGFSGPALFKDCCFYFTIPDPYKCKSTLLDIKKDLIMQFQMFLLKNNI